MNGSRKLPLSANREASLKQSVFYQLLFSMNKIKILVEETAQSHYEAEAKGILLNIFRANYVIQLRFGAPLTSKFKDWVKVLNGVFSLHCLKRLAHIYCKSAFIIKDKFEFSLKQ